MKIVHQRVALLAGVSVSAFALAAPAAAATVAGVEHNINDASVDDVLTISNIGDDAAIYGVTADGTSLGYAIVQDVNSGEIVQGGNATTGDVTLLATNGGDVTVEAIGHALNTAGSAAARGHVERAIYQFGKGPQQASIELHNSGDIAVVASGVASGTAALGLATISTAILQIADGTVASVAMSNQGEIDIDANAVANATAASAFAVASIHGIAQTAHGVESGLVSLTNAGTVDIAASAQAGGFVAGAATANVEFGVWQSAAASGTDGFAQASLDNEGMIAIDVSASAEAQMSAAAAADIGTALYQHATGSGGGAAATLTNSGTVQLTGSAVAVADNDGSRVAHASATAMVGAIRQSAIAKTISGFSGTSGGTFHYSHTVQPHGPASVSLDNSGAISLIAHAAASADDVAFANGAVTVVSQVAEGTSATVEMTNSGTISASATGEAIGGHMATGLAFGSGIHQTASAHMTHQSLTVTVASGGHYSHLGGGVGPAAVSLTNSGTISLSAHGVAIAGTPGSTAAASSSPTYAAALGHIGIGVLQQAFGSQASASIDNSGAISFAVSATATAAGGAGAQAQVDGFTQVAIATAFLQEVTWNATSASIFQGSAYIGAAVDEFTNSGTFDVRAIARADAGGFASENVHATGGLQLANGSSAAILFDNSGSFSVDASAQGVGASEFGNVAAHGLAQWEKGTDAANEKVVNSGTFEVHAVAQGTGTQGMVWDNAGAGGIVQNPLSLDTATASVVNSGTIDIQADAQAAGVTFAVANGDAVGIMQEPLFGNLDAVLQNDGLLNVQAQASASAADGAAYASAIATGFYVDGGNVAADVINSGTMSVAATAMASGNSGSAYAYAGGISIVAVNHASATTVSAGLLSGSIVNSGELNVSAKVDDANHGTVGATATGIYLLSTRNDSTVVNSGTIEVSAMTGHGGSTSATGVRVVTGFRGDAPSADDVFTFTNDGGTVIARESADGGKTWQRGMAVDVSNAPNASVINLLGDGTIYGNIAVQAGDQINVADGKTYFDGIINPGAIPAHGLDSGDLDSGLAGVGTLNIEDGGNLVLADPRITGNAAMYDGPAYALVDTLNVDAGGTLTLELQPTSGGVQPVGSYPQIFANTANLDGTLVADVTTANGLFADSYSWNNVIDAEVLTGKFDKCQLAGPNAGSLLLSFKCTYDDSDNVDLALTRLAFDEVAGLNGNGAAVGSGLECIYDVGLTGGAADMFADLFLMTDAAKYDVALNQLSGSVYANYLNSFPSLGAHYDDLVDHATDCDVPSVGGSILACRGGSPVHVWGQLDYQTRKADGDVEAGTTRAKRFTGQIGLDVAAGDATVVGVEGGYVTNRIRDRQFGDSVEAKGAQAGVYAVYDPSAFFVKGIGTFSWFNGKSTRHVDFRGLATGATFHGTPTADPDVRMWTVGVHGGARLPVGSASVATPYLNLDYVSAELDGFTETGLSGADLTVENSRSKHAFGTAGVKWTAQFGGLVPEVNLGYRYRFGNAGSTIGALFGGDADCDFDVASAAQKRGTFLAGLSVGGKLGPVDVRIGYEGEFNGDVTSHSGNFKLALPLGGGRAVAPSPPPAPVMAPPPAAEPVPAPVEAAPPPPPPPPPAATERGERGN